MASQVLAICPRVADFTVGVCVCAPASGERFGGRLVLARQHPHQGRWPWAAGCRAGRPGRVHALRRVRGPPRRDDAGLFAASGRAPPHAGPRAMMPMRRAWETTREIEIGVGLGKPFCAPGSSLVRHTHRCVYVCVCRSDARIHTSWHARGRLTALPGRWPVRPSILCQLAALMDAGRRAIRIEGIMRGATWTEASAKCQPPHGSRGR